MPPNRRPIGPTPEPGLNALSEDQQRFPDLSFGRTYVNITVRPDDDDTPVGQAEHEFAAAIDALVEA